MISAFPLRAEIFRRFLKPIKYISWIATSGLLLLSLLLPISNQQKVQFIAFWGVVVAYILAVFYVIIPRFGIHPWVHYGILFANVSFLTAGYALLGEYRVAVNSLYVIVILLGGILAGKPAAFLTAILSLMGCIAVENSLGFTTHYQLLSQGTQLIFFLVAAYMGGALGDALISHAGESQRKNADLTLLLEASLVVSSSSDLTKAIPELAQKILSGLPASFVRIDLLEGEKVNCYGLAYQRTSFHYRDDVLREFSLPDSLIYKHLLAKPQITLHTFDQLHYGDEQLSFLELFPGEIRNCCLVPLITDQKVVGILAVGEARDSERETFGANKLEFLGTLANQLAVVIENVRLHQAERQKAKRLEILYEIANVFGSTIEMEELLERLYGLLIQVIPADTYFVGFLDKQTQMVDIRLLIDEGKRFESERVPLSEGLIGYVVRTQKPLFIRSMREQWDDLPVKPLQLGQSKMSESWMGVPLGKDDHLNGILAVASYQPYVFTEEDLSLLINVAQQAKLAFDNARHHADVEKQAQHDSLTGALNHRTFLEKLDLAIEEARDKAYPLSLIMLDVDFFKEYNDNYGHVFGDEILRLAVQTIQGHIKSKDMVGRWGGEEFGVVIVDATLDEACKVARRIRETLADILLRDENNREIPAPTVSQGIACFPSQAQDAHELVEKADQALYLAKSAGRDQICVFGERVGCY